MDGNDKFWLAFWRLVAPVVMVLIVSWPAYYSHRNWVDLQLQQGGWTAQEVMCLRNAPSSEHMRWFCRDILPNKDENSEDAETQELH